MRHVGAQRKTDTQFFLVPRVLIVLRNPLPYFARGYPHDRVVIGVVVARPGKHIDPKRALFQYFRLPRQRLLDNKPQEGRISLAVSKVFALDNPLELIEKLRSAEAALFKQSPIFMGSKYLGRLHALVPRTPFGG